MRTLLFAVSVAALSACDCTHFYIEGELDSGIDAGSCTAPVSCYSYDSGVPGIGACLAGTAQCIDGELGACAGDLGPSPEACNGVDDDCNGIVDDPLVLGDVTCGLGACKMSVAACLNGKPATCISATAAGEICNDKIDNNCDGVVDEGCSCVHVSRLYGDAGNSGTAASPLATIAQGIAVALDGGFGSVCVGGGYTDAGSCRSADYVEPVKMRDGISVLGGYEERANLWARGSSNCITRIIAVDDRGVFFDHTVTSPTALDGFTIAATNANANAAITVQASTGAIISNNVISGGAGASSVGISVTNNASPTIFRNAILGGSGSASAIGVKSNGAKPWVLDNCGQFDGQGRCATYCTGARYIRGRLSGTMPSGDFSAAVWLENSPGAIVDRSSLCSGPSIGDAAALRILGDATGVVVRKSFIEGYGGSISSVGVWADACGGASPWIFDNANIQGGSAVVGARGDGLRAVGNCHPRIDSNLRIIGGEEGSANDAIAVYCALDQATGIPSKCTVQNNTNIQGSSGGLPPTSTGIRCDRGACALIENNVITAAQGIRTFGVTLNGARTLVRKNAISAGCAKDEGIGLLSVDSAARVENNEIRGAVCPLVAALPIGPAATYGVKALLAPGLNELDLHSNTISGYGSRLLMATCSSHGVTFDVGDAGVPLSPHGLVRNNIIEAGVCGQQFAFEEASAAADPRVLENNDLWSAFDGGLYLDEATTSILPPVTNLSADPLFDGGVHLSSGSMCRNAGTRSGAPLFDFDGDARPQEVLWDIGADEYVP